MNTTMPPSILVADDESNIRLVLRTTLDQEGYTIREAASGRETLAALKRAPSDLLLLDLNMPDLDGIAVLEQMKFPTDWKIPRVIMLTAYGSISTAVKAMHLGVADFVEKPVTPEDLREAVSSCLNDDQQDQAPAAPAVLESYETVLNRIRAMLRSTDPTRAEQLLMNAADRRSQHSAEYFNLLGVLYESRHKWRLARKCYDKSISADPSYAPPRVNKARVLQLRTTGMSSRTVALGDEAPQPATIAHRGFFND